MTDLLIRAVDLAKRGDREGLDPVLGDVGRRHRWAVSGAIRDAARRHDLSLEVDAALEELSQQEKVLRRARRSNLLGLALAERYMAALPRPKTTPSMAMAEPQRTGPRKPVRMFEPCERGWFIYKGDNDIEPLEVDLARLFEHDEHDDLPDELPMSEKFR